MQMKYQQKSVSEYLLTAGTVFPVIGTETGYIRPLSKIKFYSIKSSEQLPLLKEVYCQSSFRTEISYKYFDQK
jgi:hypothetical protein